MLGGLTLATELGVTGGVLLAIAAAVLIVRSWRRSGDSEAGLMTVEILYFDGCPNHETLLPRLRELLRGATPRATIELRRVEDDDAAKRERFLGSPTVRVNGHDIEPGADERNDFGLKCRLYKTPSGLRGAPPDEWLLDAVIRAPA